jgi:hypothetical protein
MKEEKAFEYFRSLDKWTGFIRNFAALLKFFLSIR